MSDEVDNVLFSHTIYRNDDKFYELRLTLSEFRENHYFNIRKYFLSYEGEYIPSKEGISMEANLDNINALFYGLISILAKSEAVEIIDTFYKQLHESET